MKKEIITKILVTIIYGICGILIFWIAASYIDVVIHNCDTNPVYTAWNIFTILFGGI